MPTILPKRSHPEVDAAQHDLMRLLGYLSAADREQVLRACAFGDAAHIHDKRKSGEPCASSWLQSADRGQARRDLQRVSSLVVLKYTSDYIARR